MKNSIIPESALFASFNAYAKAISKSTTATERENARRAFDMAILHVESGRACESKTEQARAKIRAAVNAFTMYMTTTEKRAYSNKLENALKEYRDAARGVNGWIEFINMSADEKLTFATAKARAQAVKQAEKAGKKSADYMQYSDDAAQAALLYIMFDMKEKTDRAPESVLSYMAAKTMTDNVYRGNGRKDRETTIDDSDSIDSLLYIRRAYIPDSKRETIVHDTYSEILKELKPRDRERAARLLSMMKDGYSIEQAAERLNVSRATGFNLFNRIASAAAIVKEQDSESALINFDIAKEQETEHNVSVMESWKAKETEHAPKAESACAFKETESKPRAVFDIEQARRDNAFLLYCDSEKARAAGKRQESTRAFIAKAKAESDAARAKTIKSIGR